MSADYAEIPDPKGKPVGQDENLGPVNRNSRPLYLAVIIFFGAALLIGIAGWIILALNSKQLPDGLGVILGTVAGALAALIADRGPAK